MGKWWGRDKKRQRNMQMEEQKTGMALGRKTDIQYD
jgi:hypothetical protein